MGLLDTRLQEGPQGGYLRQQFPGLFGALGGLLGTAPDQFAGSVLDPNSQAVRRGAELGFPVGTLLQVFGGLPTKSAQIGKAAARGAENLATPNPFNMATRNQGGSIDVKALQDAFPSVDFSLSQKGNQATLSKVVVPKDQRGQGVGSEFMNALTKAADSDGTQLALSPSSDFGGNKAKLIEFYKQFGFVPNKGKSIDLSISESMRREALAKPAFTYPQGKALETAQRNAAKPVSEGGLGLPANNTPMDRAKAMGFDRYDRFPGRNKELPRNQDERLWLRYGDIPEDGISRHIQNGNPEAGVSVMAPLDELSDTSWSPQMLFSMTAGEMGKRPLQVVSGNKVKAGGVFDGMGSDGEPIIKNAKKIRDATD